MKPNNVLRVVYHRRRQQVAEIGGKLYNFALGVVKRSADLMMLKASTTISSTISAADWSAVFTIAAAYPMGLELNF